MDDIPKKPDAPQPPAVAPDKTEASSSDWLTGEKNKESVQKPQTVMPEIPTPPTAETVSGEEIAPEQPASFLSTPPAPTEVPADPSILPPVEPAMPQTEATPQTPTPGLSSESVIETQPSGSGKGFRVFVTIGVLIVLAIWAAVTYIYLQNQKLKTEGEQTVAEAIASPTPTPSFSPDQVKIKSGSVVWEKPEGETVVLVNKEDYESTGITGFLKVVVSPDNAKLCFESWPPAPEPALYISDVDGQNIVEASPNRRNCLWAADSSTIYYINSASASAPVNIFSYNLASQAETDLTGSSVPSGLVRRYEIVGLSADSTALICKYEDAGGAAATDNVSNCEINLETGVVKTL